MSKMIFHGKKHLKQWLVRNPDGQRLIDEVLSEDLSMRQRMLAVAHHDRVDLYGFGPMYVTQRTQVYTTGPGSERLAEELLEESLPIGLRDMYTPNQMGMKPGKLATIPTRKLTIPEYEWWEQRRRDMEMLNNERSRSGAEDTV